MNVRQLINTLASLPPDAEVLHIWDGKAHTTIITRSECKISPALGLRLSNAICSAAIQSPTC